MEARTRCELKMYKAVGITFIAKDTKRIIMNLRSKNVKHSNTWSFWGGKVEADEQPFDALRREVIEEMGYFPATYKIHPLDIFTTKDKSFAYYTFVGIVGEEFIPVLNRESAGYCWTDIGEYPEPLHKGAYQTLSSPKNNKKLKTILKKI